VDRRSEIYTECRCESGCSALTYAASQDVDNRRTRHDDEDERSKRDDQHCIGIWHLPMVEDAVGMKQRDNQIEQGSNMADTTPHESQDWIVPGILVAVVAVLGFIIVLVMITQALEEDDTIPGQLETWSSCLRGQGANVPLVETVRGGGFRITVDGSLLEEGIDEMSLRPALEACEDQAPEGVQRIMALIGFEEFGSSGAPRLGRDFDRIEFTEICEMIDRGEIDPTAVPRRLLRLCR
jgi:hypothetical protein